MYDTLTRYRTVHAMSFAVAFETAREGSAQIKGATSPFRCSDNPDGTRFILADDARSGYAIRPDGELVYVFSTVKGRGAAIVDRAVEDGANRLDCFDGYLPSLYARHGFVVVEREANWTPGAPDVVYMRTVDGMLADGWTVDGAYNHRDGVCDHCVCPADHDPRNPS